jgi:hypothetical protein
MIPVVWREYTCTVSGSACKFVECEQCQQKYVYAMSRSVQGQGSSLYFLDNAGASNRAQDRASAQLQQELTTDCDPVPCPRCGWYQAAMVTKLRREYKPWMRWTWMLLLFASAMCALVAWLMYWTPNGPAGITLGIAGGILACAVGVMFYQRYARNRLEPNDAPQAERLQIGQVRAEAVDDFVEWLSRHQRAVEVRDALASSVASDSGSFAEDPPPVHLSAFSDRRLPLPSAFRGKMTIDGIDLVKIYVFAQDREASLDDMLMVIRDSRLKIAGGEGAGFHSSTEEWRLLPGEDEPAAIERISREIGDRHPGKAVVALGWPGTFPTIIAAFVTEAEYRVPFEATSFSGPACNTAIQA